MRGGSVLGVLAAALLLQACDGPERTTVRRPAPDAPVVAQQPAPAPAPEPAPATRAEPSPTAPELPVPEPAVPVPAPAPPAVTADRGDAEGAALLAQRRLMVPVAGIAPASLADSYRQARGGGPHEAIDILAPEGTPVVAVDDGRVAKLFTSKGGGGLTVYHFDPEGRLAYYYAHLARYADGLKQGDPVRKGQVIGYVGHTGNADPAAPHLHFAVFRLGPQRNWWQGEAVNPYPALRQAEAAPVATAAR